MRLQNMTVTYSLKKKEKRHFSKNQERYLENIVYLELRRRYKEIFYYKTEDNLEVDFPGRFH
jgi:predicted AAA+ superfamily ATPase